MATIPDEMRERVLSYITHQAVKEPASIRDVVQKGHDQLLGLLDGLSEEQARFKPGPDDWSVLEVLQHAAPSKRSVARLCAALAQGETPEREDGGAEYASLAEARSAFEAAHEEMLASIAALSSDSSVEARRDHPFFGSLNCREWAVFQRVHDGDHAQQIEQIKGASGFPASDPGPAIAEAERGPLPEPRPSLRALARASVTVRRELHRHPELSNKEHRTQKLVLDKLLRMGLEDVRPIAGTGATGLVHGAREGPNLLWRADIDALPIKEETGLLFASEEDGVMHACGHDGHIAVGLALAAALQQARGSLAGTVRFAFQPAEEWVGGAQRMIEEGVLEGPKVDRVFGLHIMANYPVGDLRVAPGPVYAAATPIGITIRGRGGHASGPQQTVDPIVVAAHAIVALQTVVSRSVRPSDMAVLTIGTIQGGERPNIIPDEVKMTGSIRTFEPKVLERVLARVEEILVGITVAWGADYEFRHSTIPAVVNDAECAETVRRVASTFLGEEHVAEDRLAGSDDMAFYLQAAPGCYFMLGGGNKERGITHPHHHAKFDFDEDCLGLGIEIAVRIIEETSGSGLG
jgi:amidohydrolase